MTSDAINQYRLDDEGSIIDDPGSPAKTFFYSHAASVEGMGYGPNTHIWISGGGAALYELGGGALQTALEGIPDQCILPGDSFESFDLDEYVAGVPPYEWSWVGNSGISISVNAENVVTVTYPGGWEGQETVTFTVTDGLGRLASDQAIFTVSPIPIVGDIPGQEAPFAPIPLDDYLLVGSPELITWSASGMVCLEVTINAVTHVATVTNPTGCSDPETITFTASVVPCQEIMSDSDDATFTPAFAGVAMGSGSAFSMSYPSPSPMNRSTRLRYSIPPHAGDSEVSLTVYDVTGHLVRTLAQEKGTPRTTTVAWDGTNDNGKQLPAGTYFFQLSWNGNHVSRRVVLLR